MNDWNLSEQYIYDGRTVRYGKLGDGPPVMMVHGTPWSSYNLRHIAKSLSKSHSVYFYDLIGYGQSSKEPGDVSLGMQNELLNHLLDYWQLDSPIIIGHDFGGAITLRTHLLNARSFKKMVLIDPVAVSPWGSPFFQYVKDHEKVFANLPDYIHEAIVKAYVKTAAYAALSEHSLDQITSHWIGESGKAAFYRQIAQADSRYTDDIEPLYKNISIPILILWGEQDKWIPIDQGRRLHKMIPSALFKVIKDAGHLVIEEKPDEVIAGILEFLYPSS